MASKQVAVAFPHNELVLADRDGKQRTYTRTPVPVADDELERVLLAAQASGVPVHVTNTPAPASASASEPTNPKSGQGRDQQNGA